MNSWVYSHICDEFMEKPVTLTTYQNQFDNVHITQLFDNLYLINNPLDEIHYHHLHNSICIYHNLHLDEYYEDE